MIWLTLVFASLLSVAGQLCQKQATCFVAINKRRKHIVLWLGLALACLGLAMVLWLLVLQKRTGRHCLPDVKSEFCLGDAGCSKTVARTGIAASLVWGGVHYWWHCDPREYGVMGLMWGLFSVIIASVAQLSLGFCGESSAADDALMGFYRGAVSFWAGCPDTVTRAAGLSAFRFLLV